MLILQKKTGITSTRLLLHGDGTGTNFVDSSVYGLTMTPNGGSNVTQVSSPAKFGNSISVTSNDSSLQTAFLPTHFQMSEATIEFWYFNPSPIDVYQRILYIVDSTVDKILDIVQYRSGLNGGRMSSRITLSGDSDQLIGTIGLTYNTWQHHAVTIDGSNIKYYLDGVPAGVLSTTHSLNFGDSHVNLGTYPTVYGDAFTGNQYFIDELRISDTILYTGPFTPPTQPFTS